MDFDARRVSAPHGQAGGAQANFHRIAERGEPDHLKLRPLDHSQFQQPLHDRGVALKRQDPTALAGSKLIEGWHGLTP
jgi:hypothetical protein